MAVPDAATVQDKLNSPMAFCIMSGGCGTGKAVTYPLAILMEARRQREKGGDDMRYRALVVIITFFSLSLVMGGNRTRGWT